MVIETKAMLLVIFPDLQWVCFYTFIVFPENNYRFVNTVNSWLCGRMSFLAQVSRSIQSTIIVNTSLSQLKNLRLRSHNERFLTFLPGLILFSYPPKNILAYSFAKIENQNLLSLAFNHPRLNCEWRKHKNKDMVFLRWSFFIFKQS